MLIEKGFFNNGLVFISMSLIFMTAYEDVYIRRQTDIEYSLSVLLPLEATLTASVEDGSRLISRSDLNLHEKGALTPAATHVWTGY